MKMKSVKRERKIISAETEQMIFNDYLFGNSRYKICKKYNVSDFRVCEIIKKSIHNNESIPLSINISPNK